MHRLLIAITAAMLIGVGGVFGAQLLIDHPLVGAPPAPPDAPPTPDNIAGIATPAPTEAPPDDSDEVPVAQGADAQATPEPTPEPRYALEPPSEGAYLGAYAPGLLEDDGIDDWNEETGAELAIAHWYQGWGDENNALYSGWLAQARAQGAVPMISWEPWEKPPGEFTDPDQPDYQLARIADGAYDDYIQEWAEVAADDGGPLLVRFAHEMNGFWYPWSVTENDNSPDDYVRAWQHVHDVVTDAGADNIRWVWAVNTLAGLPPQHQALDFVDFYPGDDYVDWVSVVGFNYGATRDWSVWRGVDAIFAETYEELVEFDKPIMISEIGTVPQGGDAGAWVREGLDVLEERYPEVQAVVWFDAPRADDINFGLEGAALEAFRERVTTGTHWQARPELVELPAQSD